jgi:serine/threonine protein kinase
MGNLKAISPTITQATTATNHNQHSFQQQDLNCVIVDGQILAERYLIRSILGRGGFGVTFLAQNTYLPGQPFCVIKQLAPTFTDPDLLEAACHQFELEALSLSRLGTHSQIPVLLDYFEIGADRYLVQEYIPGLVLTELVGSQSTGSQSTFTEAEVEIFLQQMLKLLEYLHSQCLIHRDIKPENIILCEIDRRFVLVDFGAVEDISPSTLHQQVGDVQSRAVGTLGFAPPEQLADRAVVASDLYALGMTCIYLLTGKEPGQFPTDLRTCELMWSEQIEISQSLIEIIDRLIQISLTDRYQSATQVMTALEHRSTRAKLREYLDQKYAISRQAPIGDRRSYPAVIHWALGITA